MKVWKGLLTMKFYKMEESEKIKALGQQIVELQKDFRKLSERVLRLEGIIKSLEKEYEDIPWDKMVGG